MTGWVLTRRCVGVQRRREAGIGPDMPPSSGSLEGKVGRWLGIISGSLEWGRIHEFTA